MSDKCIKIVSEASSPDNHSIITIWYVSIFTRRQIHAIINWQWSFDKIVSSPRYCCKGAEKCGVPYFWGWCANFHLCYRELYFSRRKSWCTSKYVCSLRLSNCLFVSFPLKTEAKEKGGILQACALAHSPFLACFSF